VLAEVLESDKGRTFYELPVRKRIVIMLGGPSMNLLLAFVFFAIALVGVGVNAPTLTVSSVSPCYVSEANPTGAKVGGVCKDGVSAATQAKLQPGDVITKINGESVKDWADLGAKLEAFGAGGSGTVTINRSIVRLNFLVERSNEPLIPTLSLFESEMVSEIPVPTESVAAAALRPKEPVSEPPVV